MRGVCEAETWATCLKLQAAAADGHGGPRSRREQVAGRLGSVGVAAGARRSVFEHKFENCVRG
jgi:hypothetical protein